MASARGRRADRPAGWWSSARAALVQDGDHRARAVGGFGPGSTTGATPSRRSAVAPRARALVDQRARAGRDQQERRVLGRERLQQPGRRVRVAPRGRARTPTTNPWSPCWPTSACSRTPSGRSTSTRASRRCFHGVPLQTTRSVDSSKSASSASVPAQRVHEQRRVAARRSRRHRRRVHVEHRRGEQPVLQRDQTRARGDPRGERADGDDGSATGPSCATDTPSALRNVRQDRLGSPVRPSKSTTGEAWNRTGPGRASRTATTLPSRARTAHVTRSSGRQETTPASEIQPSAVSAPGGTERPWTSVPAP